ncbi:hypothetical protein V3C99_010594 [Haemonchus contortus]
MSKSSLDAWNYALFSLECTLNVVFIPIVLLVFYICISQMNLHRNFRVTLFLIAVGYFIGDICRLIITISRMCCIALEVPSNMMTLIRVQVCAMYLSMFAWLFLIIERATASVFVGVYEVRLKGYGAPVILCGAVLLLTALFTTLSSFVGASMNFILMGMQTGIVALSLTALIVIIIFNKASYEKRHDARIRLASRYQLDENIRVGKYLVPVACNDMLTKILLIMLVTYSIFFTNIPLGQDTTHLSHAYDLLSAYQRMFFGLALTIRSEKFDHIMKRHKRTAAAVQNQVAATLNYHDELKQMW